MAGGKKKELLSALGGGGPDHMTRLEAVKMVQPQGRSVLILRVFNHGVQVLDYVKR